MKWVDVFVYDPLVPGCLRWRENVMWGRSLKRVKYPTGSPAGCKSVNGYYVVVYKGKLNYNHRIIYEMLHGPIPNGFDIDHLNGCKGDSRVENLQLKSHARNMRNMSKSKANTSGFVGVNFNAAKNTWRAHWMTLDGKRKYKNFSVSKYGDAEAFQLACEYRAIMIEQLNQQGAGYSERHGT